MKTSQRSTDRRRPSITRKLSYAGIASGAVVLVCVLVLLVFSGPLVNRFVKPRITRAFAEAYPTYSLRVADMNYSVFTNRFSCDSLALSAGDSTVSGTIGPFSIRGIRWMHLLWGGSLSRDDFANAVVQARNIVLNLQQEQYELRCGLMHVSVPDSEFGFDSLTLHPPGDDAQFFAGSKFRQTRFRLVVPRVRVAGLACLDLLKGGIYRARYVSIHDLFLDVLINKDKAFAKDSSSPPMPGEILASIPGTLGVDSLRILNGRLLYGERFVLGSTPAMITLDSMNVLAQGIANHGNPGAALVLRAQGVFMKAGIMNAIMSIPVSSPAFSYRFSGSMGGMNISVLNSFLEPAEQMRVKTGLIHEATFEINVSSGRASGNVRALYTDLKLAAVNKTTGSEKGLFDGIASTIANTFKLRGNNMLGASGSMKVGEVKYTRKREEYFLEFTWFALRSGIADVVGF